MVRAEGGGMVAGIGGLEGFSLIIWGGGTGWFFSELVATLGRGDGIGFLSHEGLLLV